MVREEEGKSRIKESIGKLGDKAIHSDNLFFTFLRSIVSSQCASWVDMGIGFALFAWLGFSAAFATAIGALCGGIVNCVINYKFTFHADGVDWRAVMVKYAMVWLGSMLLNTFGTGVIYYVICQWEWLESIGFRRDGFYAAARLFVSLMVSWFWNFPMQKFFVYSKTQFDRYAIYLFDRTGLSNFFKRNRQKQNIQ